AASGVRSARRSTSSCRRRLLGTIRRRRTQRRRRTCAARRPRSSGGRATFPVQPFPVRHGQSFHGWTVNFAYQNQINLDLLVMPDLKKETHPLALTIDMRKVGKHWLVDSVFPVAVFAPLPKQGNRGPMVSTYDLV